MYIRSPLSKKDLKAAKSKQSQGPSRGQRLQLTLTGNCLSPLQSLGPDSFLWEAQGSDLGSVLWASHCTSSCLFDILSWMCNGHPNNNSCETLLPKPAAPESSLWLKPTPSSCYAHLKSPHCYTLFLTIPQQILSALPSKYTQNLTPFHYFLHCYPAGSHHISPVLLH